MMVKATLKSIRPLLLKNMHNRLAFAHEWSEEIGARVVTTEAFGPYWHMDHPDLDWDWLCDWCEECMWLTSQYGFWGSTPWNVSHPYWDNWSNIAWYRKVNGFSSRVQSHRAVGLSTVRQPAAPVGALRKPSCLTASYCTFRHLSFSSVSKCPSLASPLFEEDQ
jgi:hypothetical protein